MGERTGRRRLFWYLRRTPETVDAELDAELRVHLELRSEELRASGMPPEDARREALRRFGDLEFTRRYCRQQDMQKEGRVQRGLLLGELVQDLRVCLRGLARSPLLALAITSTVGLGIGATTVMLSAIQGALLAPLPYSEAERLVRVYTDLPPYRFPFSVADYLALDEQQTQFERVAGFAERAMAWSDGSDAERLRGREVSWTFFSLLGRKPALGRDFTAADTRPGSPRAVIVSDGFWRRRLGGRRDALGRPLRLDGVEHRLAGVLPPSVGPLEQGREFFVAAQWTTPPRKGPFFITVLGRLRAGAEREAAGAELRAINRRIFPLWRTSYQDEKASWGMMELKQYVVGDVRGIAGTALAATALVWLIACANASSLLVARVTSRRRELAVRTALGASRTRVVRHLLAESGLLALAAAAVGALVAWSGIGLLRRVGQVYWPRTQELAFDAGVVALLLVLTLASGLLFGLIPALQGTGGRVDDSLRSSGRSATGSLAVRRLRRALVAAQFAIATPLLVAAALLLASLNQLGRVDLGFDGSSLLTGAIQLPRALYPEEARAASFWVELEERLEALPGVASVAFADGRAPNEVNNLNNFDLEERPTPAGQSQPVSPWIAVTPDYFRVLGLALAEGRLLDERDARAENLEAVVVDRAWARRFFPNESVLGKRFREGGCTSCPWTSVVGVVGEVKYTGLDKPDEGTVYSPLSPGALFRYLVVRTTVAPATVVPGLRQTLRQLDPSLPLASVATVDELVAGSLQRPRSLSILVGALAGMALLLSSIAVYGVMAYYVQQHAKEIGVRLALGGGPGDVLRLVVGQGMRVVTAGVGVGLLAALLATRVFESLLFGVGAHDAAAFAGVGGLLLAVALLACLVPARRATGLPPARVLRDE